MTGFIVLLVALIAASAFGLHRRRSDGKVRQVGEPAVVQDRLTPAVLGSDLGDRATLVQFSSAFCAPCRSTRTLLRDVCEQVPGVVFAEVDAEQNLDLVRALKVTRTPTVLVLDAAGQVRNRAVGLPRRDELMAALGAAMP